MIWQLINLFFRFSGRIYFSNEQKSWTTALRSSKSYNDKNIFNKLINLYDLIKYKDIMISVFLSYIVFNEKKYLNH